MTNGAVLKAHVVPMEAVAMVPQIGEDHATIDANLAPTEVSGEPDRGEPKVRRGAQKP